MDAVAPELSFADLMDAVGKEWLNDLSKDKIDPQAITGNEYTDVESLFWCDMNELVRSTMLLVAIKFNRSKVHSEYY
jgi:hypothetical protein